MEDLLTLLNRIAPYTSEQEFTRLCWRHLIQVANSKETNKWDLHKRGLFMEIASFLIESGRAAFIMRDMLIAHKELNLNKLLIGRLGEHLNWLEEFSTEVDAEDLHEVINECTNIFVNEANDYWETVVMECVASYLKIFFLSVHSLEIPERIKLTCK